jgi:hypothetical protein
MFGARKLDRQRPGRIDICEGDRRSAAVKNEKLIPSGFGSRHGWHAGSDGIGSELRGPTSAWKARIAAAHWRLYSGENDPSAILYPWRIAN